MKIRFRQLYSKNFISLLLAGFSVLHTKMKRQCSLFLLSCILVLIFLLNILNYTHYSNSQNMVTNFTTSQVRSLIKTCMALNFII